MSSEFYFPSLDDFSVTEYGDVRVADPRTADVTRVPGREHIEYCYEDETIMCSIDSNPRDGLWRWMLVRKNPFIYMDDSNFGGTEDLLAAYNEVRDRFYESEASLHRSRAEESAPARAISANDDCPQVATESDARPVDIPHIQANSDVMVDFDDIDRFFADDPHDPDESASHDSSTLDGEATEQRPDMDALSGHAVPEIPSWPEGDPMGWDVADELLDAVNSRNLQSDGEGTQGAVAYPTQAAYGDFDAMEADMDSFLSRFDTLSPGMSGTPPQAMRSQARTQPQHGDSMSPVDRLFGANRPEHESGHDEGNSFLATWRRNAQ